MNDKRFDTADLREIQTMLAGDAGESYDIEDILREFGGGKSAPPARPQTEQTAPSGRPARPSALSGGTPADCGGKESADSRNDIGEAEPRPEGDGGAEPARRPAAARYGRGRDMPLTEPVELTPQTVERFPEEEPSRRRKAAERGFGEAGTEFQRGPAERQGASVNRREKKGAYVRESVGVGDTGKLRASVHPYPRRSGGSPRGVNEIGDISQVREEPIQPKDPKVATKKNARRAKSLRARSRLVLLFTIAAALLSFAGMLHLPLPETIDFAKSPFVVSAVLTGLQAAGMLLLIDVVGFGLISLFRGKPILLSALSIAQLAVLAHCVVGMIWGGELPYTAVSLCALFIAALSEADKYAGKQYIYKVAALTPAPVGVFYHKEENGKDCIVKNRVQNMEEFLVQVETPDGLEMVYGAYAVAAIVISVILSVLASGKTGVRLEIVRNLAVMMTASVSFSLLASYGLPFKSIARKLLSAGAAVASVKRAEKIRKTKRVVVKDGDMFPAGTISMEGFKVYNGHRGDKVLAYATAAMTVAGSETYRVFAETLRERYGAPVRATDALTYESGGVSVTIRGDSVLVGTASFIMRMGIRIHEGKQIRSGVFVVINNEIAGIFALKYSASAASYGGMQTLLRNNKIPVLATRDFNITPPLVEEKFDLRRGITEYPAIQVRNDMGEGGYTKGDVLCGILSRDGIVPYSGYIQAASRLTGALRSNLVVGMIAGGLGMILTYFLAAVGSENLSPFSVLIYLLLWYVPTIMFSKHVNRPY